jgi:hypothetical protein
MGCLKYQCFGETKCLHLQGRLRAGFCRFLDRSHPTSWQLGAVSLVFTLAWSPFQVLTGDDHPNGGCSLFSPVPPNECRNNIKLGPKCFLPHPFQLMLLANLPFGAILFEVLKTSLNKSRGTQKYSRCFSIFQMCVLQQTQQRQCCRQPPHEAGGCNHFVWYVQPLVTSFRVVQRSRWVAVALSRMTQVGRTTRDVCPWRVTQHRLYLVFVTWLAIVHYFQLIHLNFRSSFV